MMAHKMIDAVKSKAPGVMIIPKGDALSEIIDKVRKAEKFDFGELMLEQTTTVPIPRFGVPRLSDEEHDFFDQGLVPLPAPLTWFECRINGYTSGLLVDGDNSDAVTRIDFERHHNSGAIDGVWVIGEKQDKPNTPTANYARYQFRLSGDQTYLEKCYGKAGDVDFGEATPLGRSMSHGSNWYLARYLTLMLNSRSSKRVPIDGAAPGTLVGEGKREKRPAHTIVTIVPREYFAYARQEGQEVRASPRLHWRRSHIRTLSDGRKLVIPRFLVGRADLGTISHEYKVPQER